MLRFSKKRCKDPRDFKDRRRSDYFLTSVSAERQHWVATRPVPKEHIVYVVTIVSCFTHFYCYDVC